MNAQMARERTGSAAESRGSRGAGAPPAVSSANRDELPPALSAGVDRLVLEALRRGLEPTRAVALVLLAAYQRRGQLSRLAAEDAVKRRREASDRVRRKREAFAALAAKPPAERDERTRSTLARELFDLQARAMAAGVAMQRALLVAAQDAENARRACVELAELTSVRSPKERPAESPEWSTADLARDLAREVAAWDTPTPPRVWHGPEAAKPMRAGPFRVVRRTDQVWVVLDERRAVGDRTVAEVGPWMREANELCALMGSREGFAAGEGETP